MELMLRRVDQLTKKLEKNRKMSRERATATAIAIVGLEMQWQLVGVLERIAAALETAKSHKSKPPASGSHKVS